MAVKNAASVAAVAARRGAGALSVADHIWLQENGKSVKAVTKEIEKVAKVARAATKAATEAEAAAATRLAAAEAAEGAALTAASTLEVKATRASAKHEREVAGLNSRMLAVVNSEGGRHNRERLMDERDSKFEADGLAREAEYAEREKAIETREGVADEIDTAQHNKASDLNDREAAILSVETMAKQIVVAVKAL
jgi:hypothetical protein